jgi:FtsZ-binding cell division protein ZapB
MEAPSVKEEIKVENSYKIISDKNNSFNLIFQNLNSSIQIIASYEDNILTHYYEKNIIFDEFKKNKFLALCDSIDKIYDELIHNLNKNQTKIIEETNQIIINIPTDHIKIKEILFIVFEKIKNDKETINELLSIISNLKEEINDLKTNKIENMNEKINNLEKENEILKQYLPYLEEYKKN